MECNRATGISVSGPPGGYYYVGWDTICPHGRNQRRTLPSVAVIRMVPAVVCKSDLKRSDHRQASQASLVHADSGMVGSL